MLHIWREDLGYVARGLWRSRAFSLAAVLPLAAGAAGAILVFTIRARRPSPAAARAAIRSTDRAWRDLPAACFTTIPSLTTRSSGPEPTAAGSRGRRRVDANGVGRDVLVVDGLATDVRSASSPALLRGARRDARTWPDAHSHRRCGRAPSRSSCRRGLWRSRYAASPAILGRRVTLGGRRFTNRRRDAE